MKKWLVYYTQPTGNGGVNQRSISFSSKYQTKKFIKRKVKARSTCYCIVYVVDADGFRLRHGLCATLSTYYQGVQPC